MTSKGRQEPSAPLTHVDQSGKASMVDVSAKAVTLRMARAQGTIRMSSAAFEAIRSHQVRKGDVLSVARIAGIMAAKKTAELVPLCHPLPLEDVQVDFEPDPGLPGFRVTSQVRVTGRTGVEMEAIVAASVALITVYDMAKSADRAMTIGDISLVEKSGGRSGAYVKG